jgi:hypothetical protein
MVAIETKYLGATNYKPSRIRATDGNKSVTVSYDHGLDTYDNHKAAARLLIKRRGWTPKRLVGGSTKRGYCFVME